MKLKKKKKRPSLYRKTASKLFLSYVNKNKEKYEGLKEDYLQSGLRPLFEIYLCTMFFSTILLFLVPFGGISLTLYLLGYPILESLSLAGFISLLVSLLGFFVLYTYPRNKSKSRERSIENNLPFAIIYMAGVAESGVPPQNIFRLLAKAEGFGEVKKEAKYIVYLMGKRNYGLLNALKKCANKTPSQTFKEFLLSLLMTIKYGGELETFLKTEASRKEVDYKLKAREYEQKLSMYSTIYTGLFIAAPVLFVSMFSLMNFFSPIGGTGLLEQMVVIGLPLVNIIYLYYLYITKPEL